VLGLRLGETMAADYTEQKRGFHVFFLNSILATSTKQKGRPATLLASSANYLLPSFSLIRADLPLRSRK